MNDIKDLSSYKNVWIFAEQREGKIAPVVIELLGEGRKLAKEVDAELCAILLGKDVDGLAKELITFELTKFMLQMMLFRKIYN